MRATALDVGLRNGGHSQLVECSCIESSESAGEWNLPASSGNPYGNPDEVLLGNETLHVPVLVKFQR